jgi:hypothetical protein
MLITYYLIQEEQKEQPKVPVDPITSTPTPKPAYTRSPKVSIVVKNNFNFDFFRIVC